MAHDWPTVLARGIWRISYFCYQPSSTQGLTLPHENYASSYSLLDSTFALSCFLPER